jgi:hypothetical protein
VNRAKTVTAPLTGLTASTASRCGPDMQQLHGRFPPRIVPLSWPGTELDRDRLLARVLAAPFIDGGLDLRQRRRRGLTGVVNWLADQSGATCSPPGSGTRFSMLG